MIRRIRILRHERGIVRHRDGWPIAWLRPGVHWVFGPGRRVDRVAGRLDLEPADLDLVLDLDGAGDDVAVTDLTDDQRAILIVDRRVADVVGPGRHAWIRGPREARFEVHDIAETRLVHRQLAAVLATEGGQRHLFDASVPAGSRGLLHVDGRLEGENDLAPGRYAFWLGVGKLALVTVDLRESAIDVTGQEILTADKVSLRVNLVAAYRVIEPRVAHEATADLSGALYRELQLALRESVGRRELDELLANKERLGDEIRAAVEAKARKLGVELGSVGVKDVILPGDMKLLLNQVIEAQKRAQANLIARREETAATRALLNTAKMIEGSPALLRLKELEAAERMAASIDSIQVVGGHGLDAVLEQLLPGGRRSNGH